MKRRKVTFVRKTAETEIHAEIQPDGPVDIQIDSTVPFLDHLLRAAAFHGGFGLKITARGDLAVDAHHTVEDIGIVLGECLKKLVADHGPIKRFGHSVIPMDEAVAEVVMDVCGRPTLVFEAAFPQDRVGSFDVALLREMLLGLSAKAGWSLHAHIRCGQNSHHMVEALFKALGKAIKQAYAPDEAVQSTKGTIEV